MILVLLGPAGQSKSSEAPPAVDPYTRGEPEAMERLGYRSFGPMRFGLTTSDVIAAVLGDVPLLWVETEHFLVGSSLSGYTSSEDVERARLRTELEGLRQVLERVSGRWRKLDPWLRLHLTARRLERLRADFVVRLGLVEHSAETADSGAPALAMKGKLAVLLTEKKSTLARFTQEYCPSAAGDPVRAFFDRQGVLFYGLSAEALGRASDADLHYVLVFGVAQNLLSAINGYPRLPPDWWSYGLALWFAREVEPQVQLFARPASEYRPGDELADWRSLVRGRVQAGLCLTWPEVLERPAWPAQAFSDNVVLWSRIDHLLATEGVAARLVARLHDRRQALDSTPALAAATGLGLEELEAAWRAWVLDTYPKGR